MYPLLIFLFFFRKVNYYVFVCIFYSLPLNLYLALLGILGDAYRLKISLHSIDKTTPVYAYGHEGLPYI